MNICIAQISLRRCVYTVVVELRQLNKIKACNKFGGLSSSSHTKNSSRVVINEWLLLFTCGKSMGCYHKVVLAVDEFCAR